MSKTFLEELRAEYEAVEANRLVYSNAVDECRNLLDTALINLKYHADKAMALAQMIRVYEDEAKAIADREASFAKRKVDLSA